MKVELLTGTGPAIPGELVIHAATQTAYFNPADKDNPSRLVIANASVNIGQGERGANGVCVGIDIEGFLALADAAPTKYEKRRLMFNHIYCEPATPR